MEKLAENDLAYFYLRHVAIIVTAVTMISLPPVVQRACPKISSVSYGLWNKLKQKESASAIIMKLLIFHPILNQFFGKNYHLYG